MELGCITLDEIDEKEVNEAYGALMRSRSKFQFDRFVLGPHATEAHQYLHCVLELRLAMVGVKRARLNTRKLRRKLETTDPFSGSTEDREELELELEEAELGRTISERELVMIWRRFKTFKSFTAEELEEAEQTYWTRRLFKQAWVDIMATGRIGVGNLDALLNAGLVDHDPVADFKVMLEKNLIQGDHVPELELTKLPSEESPAT